MFFIRVTGVDYIGGETQFRNILIPEGKVLYICDIKDYENGIPDNMLKEINSVVHLDYKENATIFLKENLVEIEKKLNNILIQEEK